MPNKRIEKLKKNAERAESKGNKDSVFHVLLAREAGKQEKSVKAKKKSANPLKA